MALNTNPEPSSNDEFMDMPGPRTTPEPEKPPEKPGIFNFNASNPRFIPGYSVLRVEQAKYTSNEKDKTRLVNSIVDDLIASISLINQYHQAGILSNDNIFQFSTMLQHIDNNNTKLQERWDEKIAYLRQDRHQLRQHYRDLVRQMDAMGQKYAARVKALEGQVMALKMRLSWVEAGGLLRLSPSRLNGHADRRCVSEDLIRREGHGEQKGMAGDDADGEWEQESIYGDAKE
jgi:hypothetical protein